MRPCGLSANGRQGAAPVRGGPHRGRQGGAGALCSPERGQQGDAVLRAQAWYPGARASGHATREAGRGSTRMLREKHDSQRAKPQNRLKKVKGEQRGPVTVTNSK